MRRLHRWFGLIAGVFFAFVALTGIGMQAIELFKAVAPPPPAAATHNAPPKDGAESGKPDRAPRKVDFYHWLNHIHTGEFVGPWGRVVSLLLGLALLFFSVSGIWMYWKMFDARQRIGKKDLFW